ncbi:MAG: anhydro-N-acetylmuramic acid kinase [Chitinophagaceae bacterium]|nr:MAG: anhydro-N-acetylmuramic acid kinase [Chitinophagaceae bacterium]
MVYRAIGVVSGGSLNGLDIMFAELQETTGKWTAEILAGERIPFEPEISSKLKTLENLSSFEYHEFNVVYGKYLAKTVRDFIDRNQLHYKVQLIACDGHTALYKPDQQICSQVGDLAQVAAITGINVVGNVRSSDLSLGGRGAPIFPVVEKLLFSGEQLFLHLGSNANLTRHLPGDYKSFDVCPANRLLDKLAARDNQHFDPGGAMAAEGNVDENLLEILNELEYYRLPLPKTLSIDFSMDVVYPLFDKLRMNVKDALRTAVEHIAIQIANGVKILTAGDLATKNELVISGGGANNDFLVDRIRTRVGESGITVPEPVKLVANFKEPLAMALIGVLRWREENNVFGYITGAKRDSIGGAVWVGQEA